MFCSFLILRLKFSLPLRCILSDSNVLPCGDGFGPRLYAQNCRFHWLAKCNGTRLSVNVDGIGISQYPAGRRWCEFNVAKPGCSCNCAQGVIESERPYPGDQPIDECSTASGGYCDIQPSNRIHPLSGVICNKVWMNCMTCSSSCGINVRLGFVCKHCLCCKLWPVVVFRKHAELLASQLECYKERVNLSMTAVFEFPDDAAPLCKHATTVRCLLPCRAHIYTHGRPGCCISPSGPLFDITEQQAHNEECKTSQALSVEPFHERDQVERWSQDDRVNRGNLVRNLCNPNHKSSSSSRPWIIHCWMEMPTSKFQLLLWFMLLLDGVQPLHNHIRAVAEAGPDIYHLVKNLYYAARAVTGSFLVVDSDTVFGGVFPIEVLSDSALFHIFDVHSRGGASFVLQDLIESCELVPFDILTGKRWCKRVRSFAESLRRMHQLVYWSDGPMHDNLLIEMGCKCDLRDLQQLQTVVKFAFTHTDVKGTS